MLVIYGQCMCCSKQPRAQIKLSLVKLLIFYLDVHYMCLGDECCWLLLLSDPPLGVVAFCLISTVGVPDSIHICKVADATGLSFLWQQHFSD